MSDLVVGMVRVPGGEFAMGSEAFYPEERPVRRVGVEGFRIDERPVTVAEFRRFVKATGHVTVAEPDLDPADYPDADPADLVPGSLVFRPSRGPVDLRDVRNWWAYVPGARWERPEGPGSDTYTRGRHPVTQVAHEDAVAYAAWAGKACRPRPSGSTLRAAASRAPCTRGATSSTLRWRTPGWASFPGSAPARPGRPRPAATRRTDTASTT